jgi:hypothetical protein
MPTMPPMSARSRESSPAAETEGVASVAAATYGASYRLSRAVLLPPAKGGLVEALGSYSDRPRPKSRSATLIRPTDRLVAGAETTP